MFLLLLKSLEERREATEGKQFFAIILEKLFKACLNLNVHLRHTGYLELNLYLKLNMISGFRSLHQ